MLIIQLHSYSQSTITDFEYELNAISCDYIMAKFFYPSNSSDDADSCCWYFGDGATKFSTYSNSATHTYSKSGLYTVTLTLWKNGVKSVIEKKDLVKVAVPPVPKFDIDISDINGFAPLMVGFQNKTELGEGTVVNYSWSFGDGSYSIEKDPQYVYNKPDTYFVTLKVGDSNGCEKEFYDYVTVKDTAQRGEFEFINTNCISENEPSPCGYDINYELINETLLVYGYYYGNCGAYKTATIRYAVDSVKIRTWEVGPLTTCSCGYCFEIEVPDITQLPKKVLFNNELIEPMVSDIDDLKNTDYSLKVFPNPTNDVLNLDIENLLITDCEYRILNFNGRVIQKGLLDHKSQIKLTNINQGVYFIVIRSRLDQKEYITRFVKI